MNEPVVVWDLPVRLVHWAMVLLLIGLVTTGLEGADWMVWHLRFGQAMLALVVFRVIWGFVGSRNARFASFLDEPAAVVRYARSMFRAHELYATHNPLGGWMVVLLLVALLCQAVAGLFTYDDILWSGPLAEKVSQDTSKAFSTFHRRFWWVVVTLSVIHVVAVLAYLAVLRDNLVTPMFTGVKMLPSGDFGHEDGTASTMKAVVLLAIVWLPIWYVFNKLG